MVDLQANSQIWLRLRIQNVGRGRPEERKTNTVVCIYCITGIYKIHLKTSKITATVADVGSGIPPEAICMKFC
jgi:hypothetical protein